MKGASRISITFVSPEFITVPGIDEVLNMYLLNEQMNKKYNYQRLQTVWESELRETRFSKIDLVMAVQFHDTLKIIELYTLNEWIVWYVNCSSIIPSLKLGSISTNWVSEWQKTVKPHSRKKSWRIMQTYAGGWPGLGKHVAASQCPYCP